MYDDTFPSLVFIIEIVYVLNMATAIFKLSTASEIHISLQHSTFRTLYCRLKLY